MKIIILEGIATSGKSLLAKELAKAMDSNNVKIFEESETHEPIMDKTDETHVDFFKSLIKEAIKSKADIVIFERLYLTQAFRAKTNLEEYSDIEDLLKSYSPLTIFLKVDSNSIAGRVQKATEHRDTEWAEYVRAKDPDGTAQYYIDQQRHQLELLKQSKIPYQIIDTTNHNYAKLAKDIATQIT